MLVVDASVVVEVLLRTPRAAAIEAQLFAWPGPWHAPHLPDVEVAQVLRRFAARGTVTAARGAAALRLLDQLPLTRHPHQPLLARVWALREHLSAHDAMYAALAEALGGTLLTADERLGRAPGLRAPVLVVPKPLRRFGAAVAGDAPEIAPRMCMRSV